MSRCLACWVGNLLLVCVNRVFYVVMVHVCNLSGWQPVGPWAAACWWTPTTPAESGKSSVCPATRDTSPARVQHENRHICLQHCSSARRRRNLRSAGYGYREPKPERGMLGTVYSNTTQNFMHFMDQHRGGLCASLPAFPPRGVLGSHSASPFPGTGWHHSNMLHGRYFTGRRKGCRQWAEIPSVLPFGSCPGPVPL